MSLEATGVARVASGTNLVTAIVQLDVYREVSHLEFSPNNKLLA